MIKPLPRWIPPFGGLKAAIDRETLVKLTPPGGAPEISKSLKEPLTPVQVVFQWSIRPEETGDCEDHLARVVEHITADHPTILAVRTFRQWTGPLPRRAYIWLEEYENLATLESSPDTPACADVWKPIEAMAQAGTWTTSIWLDAAPHLQLARDQPGASR